MLLVPTANAAARAPIPILLTILCTRIGARATGPRDEPMRFNHCPNWGVNPNEPSLFPVSLVFGGGTYP